MPNRLQHANSPYLLQHADNPVDWYPWGESAFQEARRRDVPIFLSIGYAACHWCHVMEHESFEDAETANFINQHFVSVKVDREERPDVDALYMQAVTAITGQGGWPLSVFLTPEGEPFYGGTYFPPVRRYNMPSFMEVLEFINQRWNEDRQSLLKSGQELTRHISHSLDLSVSESGLNAETLSTSAEALWKTYDWEHGGWGSAPKFPSATTVEFLLAKNARQQDQLALDMAKHALSHMAHGGLFDQIRGGFHRYSVDRAWLVPHFEKMLYDNALLGTAYIHGWKVTGEPVFKRTALKTLDWLLSEMRDPRGGFYASLDADSEGVEGKFYIWKWEEIADALNDEDLTQLFCQVYGVSQEGNFEGANVLHRPRPSDSLTEELNLSVDEIEIRLAEAERGLLEVRAARERPRTDDKIIAGWNGLVLTFLSEASRFLDRDAYLPIAQGLANFLTSEMLINGRLHRSWRQGHGGHPGTLEDYGAVANGLIDLYQADFNPTWIDTAQRLLITVQDQFADSQGGYFDSPSDQTDLIARPKSLQDSPIPSGNSLVARAMLRLDSLTPQPQWEENVLQLLSAMQSTAEKYPSMFSAWLVNIDWALGPITQIAIAGDLQDSELLKMIRVSDEVYIPRLIRAGGAHKQSDVVSLMDSRTMIDNRPTAYLCQDFACKLPTSSPEILRQQIADAVG